MKWLNHFRKKRISDESKINETVKAHIEVSRSVGSRALDMVESSLIHEQDDKKLRDIARETRMSLGRLVDKML